MNPQGHVSFISSENSKYTPICFFFQDVVYVENYGFGVKWSAKKNHCSSFGYSIIIIIFLFFFWGGGGVGGAGTTRTNNLQNIWLEQNKMVFECF